MTSREPLQVIRGAEQAVILLRPLRTRLLEALREPDSAAGLARKLELPRQQINYHLRTLEKQGLVELVEERRRGNCVERVVRATALTYVVSPAALGALGVTTREAIDRFSAGYLVAAAAQVIEEVSELQIRAREARKHLATFTLHVDVRFASAGDRAAFTEELTNTVATLVARYHNEHAEGGRAFRYVLGGYPAASHRQAGAPSDQTGSSPTKGS